MSSYFLRYRSVILLPRFNFGSAPAYASKRLRTERLRSTILREVGTSISEDFCSCESVRDGFDGEAEIVGDVLAGHRQLDDAAAGRTIGHFQKEAGDPFPSALDEHQDMVLDSLQLAGCQRPHSVRTSLSLAGTAIRARPYLQTDRHGRDGLRVGP